MVRRTSSRTGAPPVNLTWRAKVVGWVLDYCYVVYWMARGLVSRTSAGDLLHPPTPGSPVVLIPGVYESWRFMQPIAQYLFGAGHPVHVLDKLGYNTGGIPEMATIVSAYLEETDLSDVTFVAHSKGGLIGKYALARPETQRRVRHLIAINSPFSGSRYAYLFLLRSVRMFRPTGPIIRELTRNVVVNSKISSLYSAFDPHIPETSHLPGAVNIVLPTVGHFRPIADPRTYEVIATILAGGAADDERPVGDADAADPAGSAETRRAGSAEVSQPPR
jgi:triacylglycerol lipase